LNDALTPGPLAATELAVDRLLAASGTRQEADFHEAADALLALPPSTDATAFHKLARVVCGLIQDQPSRLRRCPDLMRALNACADASDNWNLRHLSLLIEVNFIHVQGRLDDAYTKAMEAVSLAERFGDARASGVSWNILGRVLGDGGFIRMSRDCYLKAAGYMRRMAPDDWTMFGLAVTYCNAGVACSRSHEFAFAIEHCKEAISYLPPLPSAEINNVRARIELVYTRAALALGDLSTAAFRAAMVQKLADHDGALAVRASAEYTRGLTQAYSGDQAGIATLERGLQLATEGFPTSVLEFRQALAQANEVLGNHQAALRHLRDLRERAVARAIHRIAGKDGELVEIVDAERAKLQTELRRGTSTASPAVALQDLAERSLAREDESGERTVRTGALTGLLWHALGQRDAETAQLAGALYDVGKTTLPDSIAGKKSRLSPAEVQVVNEHTTEGEALIARSWPEAPQAVLHAARHHHEYFDGSGMPDRLAGEAIPIIARVVHAVDAFDAMTHDRPYRRAMSPVAALVEMRSRAGTQFDPRVVDELEKFVRKGLVDGTDLRETLVKGARNSSYAVLQRALANVRRGLDRQAAPAASQPPHEAPPPG
jgi:HD-GYP domain-containing protein (c-di-GMP phosphodiesterase class II)